MEPPLWTEGASPWPHEREAFAFVRSRLPDHEPYRAWTNVEFIAEDGSVNEVDLLVVTPAGLFVVEVKSFPGKLFGDGQRWRLEARGGSLKLLDHPLILANTKAKRLRSLLARQPKFERERPPWVTPLVFLSSPELDCRLHDIALTAVCGRDPEPLGQFEKVAPAAATAFDPLPGIVATLKEPAKARQRGQAINRPMSAKIAQAVESAGLHPSNRGRKVGDWDLGELLDEGPGWQDWLASRPRVHAKRRARVYLAGVATTAEDQDRLRREAEREFRIVQDLRHDGIAQPLDLVQAERGPALLYELFEGEQRLDLWANDAISSVPLDQRIEMVRQLAEAVAHAHANRVTHRALTPRDVLVRPAKVGAAPWLVIGHWQAGARELATSLTRHPSDAGTNLASVLTERLEAEEQVYLAPEAFSAERPDGAALDVFSLGALAFLLLAGRPPASDLTEREAVLAAHHCLALDVAVDNLPVKLVEFVAYATDPVPSKRATLKDLLELLDEALEELIGPSREEEIDPFVHPLTADPLTAHQGEVLEGGWEVLRRLGSGSTAVALLCQRQGSTEPEVLKVAKDEEHAERLRDEERSLRHLHHSGVVQVLGLERVGGRTTLRLAPAGDPGDKLGMTLADRLANQGRMGLDLLERFGDDLLETVSYLESEGVHHRDIKPDNLGVRPRRADRSLHLVLFDFSLSRTPDASLFAGTAGYLDPFLAERQDRRWDLAAERYAAAVTLYEMATGARPVWGDGRTDPLHLSDQLPRIDAELFDPAVRDGMERFFTTALQRDPKQRFDSSLQMRQAWRAAFATAGRPKTRTDEDRAADVATLERLADAATKTTPVVELGFSGAATSALERLGIATVAQLLDYPVLEWNRAPGVGLQVRREVLEALARLRPRFDADVADEAASIDRLAGALIPRPSTPQAQADAPALVLLLGLQGNDVAQLPLGAAGTDVGALPAWPGPAELAAHLGLDRAGYDELVSRARARWAKQPGMTEARNDLCTLLERASGVLPGDDAALALLAQRGSTATGQQRLRRARAVVRAALETEAVRAASRFTWRRLGGGASAVIALQGEALDAEELADYAASLGRVADQLANADPLPSPAVALEQLRQVAVPVGLGPLDEHRLVRLATSASATAATSSRLEVYPRGMPAVRALRLARGALLGTGTLSEESVRERVRARFPDAEPLPERPELDALLRDKIGLEWFPGGPGPAGAPLAAGFRVPPPPSPRALTAITVSGSRYRTGTGAQVPDEARLSAELADERLRRHAKSGGYLVLSVRPSRYESARRSLEDMGATEVNLDRLLIEALRERARDKRIRWQEAIVATDAAGPASPQWPKLLAVVGDSLPLVKALLLAGPSHVLLTYPGLLARYQSLGLLDELREATTRRSEPAQALRVLWALVPSEDPEVLPTVDGQAVPVTTGAEHMALPEPWLKNVHHTAEPVGGQSP